MIKWPVLCYRFVVAAINQLSQYPSLFMSDVFRGVLINSGGEKIAQIRTNLFRNIVRNEKLWRKTSHTPASLKTTAMSTVDVSRSRIGLSRVNFCNGYLLAYADDDDSADTAVILIEIVRDDRRYRCNTCYDRRQFLSLRSITRYRDRL